MKYGNFTFLGWSRKLNLQVLTIWISRIETAFENFVGNMWNLDFLVNKCFPFCFTRYMVRFNILKSNFSIVNSFFNFVYFKIPIFEMWKVTRILYFKNYQFSEKIQKEVSKNNVSNIWFLSGNGWKNIQYCECGTQFSNI